MGDAFRLGRTAWHDALHQRIEVLSDWTRNVRLEDDRLFLVTDPSEHASVVMDVGESLLEARIHDPILKPLLQVVQSSLATHGYGSGVALTLSLAVLGVGLDAPGRSRTVAWSVLRRLVRQLRSVTPLVRRPAALPRIGLLAEPWWPALQAQLLQGRADEGGSPQQILDLNRVQFIQYPGLPAVPTRLDGVPVRMEQPLEGPATVLLLEVPWEARTDTNRRGFVGVQNVDPVAQALRRILVDQGIDAILVRGTLPDRIRDVLPPVRIASEIPERAWDVLAASLPVTTSLAKLLQGQVETGFVQAHHLPRHAGVTARRRDPEHRDLAILETTALPLVVGWSNAHPTLDLEEELERACRFLGAHLDAPYEVRFEDLRPFLAAPSTLPVREQALWDAYVEGLWNLIETRALHRLPQPIWDSVLQALEAASSLLKIESMRSKTLSEQLSLRGNAGPTGTASGNLADAPPLM